MSGLEAVLALHVDRGRAEQIHPPDGPNCGWAVVRVCGCLEWSAPVMADSSDKDAHRAHVAAAIREYLLSAEVVERAGRGAAAYDGVRDDPSYTDLARAALTAATEEDRP